MSTTDAARESARQRNGRFGPQRRSEPDPAIAGLDAPDWSQYPRTYDEAVARGKMSELQCSEYRLVSPYAQTVRVVEFHNGSGDLVDVDSRTPSRMGFGVGGEIVSLEWTSDPAVGVPAMLTFNEDGSVFSRTFRMHGVLPDQSYGESWPIGDPPDGYIWVPVQRNDLMGVYDADADAATAYATHVGSPVPPVWGDVFESGDSPDVFVAVPRWEP